jgi:hypothetical protein
MDRAYSAVRAGYNRLNAAWQDLEATQAAYDGDQASVELLLDSQQRLAEAQSRYYRSLADHAISLKNVHRQKGSLLQLNGIYLREGGWPDKAYRDAAELKDRLRPRRWSKTRVTPAPISGGEFPQRIGMESAVTTEVTTTSVSPAVDTAPRRLLLREVREQLLEALPPVE